MAYIYTPFMKKVLHITERKRETNVHHHRQADNLGAGFEIAEGAAFCHQETLTDRPAWLNQISSDTSVSMVRPRAHGLGMSRQSLSRSIGACSLK